MTAHQPITRATDHIDHTTRRAYRVTGKRLDLWTLIGGWFSRGDFESAEKADYYGREFVRTGHWPHNVDLLARMDRIAQQRGAMEVDPDDSCSLAMQNVRVVGRG